MDLLHEWLAPTMTREIGALMQLKTGASDMSHSADGVTYSDDGSNLRASCSKPGVVQITKFYTFEGPIKVAISDAYTYMRATIASSAAAKYAAIEKKRVTKDTLGGLIQIRNFEIVATHLGSRPERATILINDFKSIGCEGSGGFGSPRPLEIIPEIAELLDQLKTIRGRENQGMQLRSGLESASEGSLARSQPDVEGSGIGSPETSQMMFATQVPSCFSEHPLETDGEAQPETVSISAGNKITDTANDNAIADMPQRQGYPSVNAKAKANGKPRVNTSEALLRLIAPKQLIPRPMPKQILSQKPTAPLPNSGNMYRDIHPEPKNPLASGATIEEVSFATPPNHIQGIDKQVHGPKVTSFPPLATESIGELTSRAKVTDGSLAVHAGTSARKTREMNPSEQAAIGPNFDHLPKSLKRIRRNDIKVPKDQQVLLDRADCWLPAEPGQRGPVANVPLPTLQAINCQAERTAHRLSISQDHQRQGEVVDAETSVADHLSPGLGEVSKADSDSERPLSSAEWPPTSPFEQPSDELPPDSSMESIEYPVHEKSGDVNMSGHVPPKRKLSITSMSSTATRSTRRNPKRTSKALQGTAPSSPSLVSASADEKAKRFKCQELGCDKAYTGASGLRYHMEHFHTAAKSNGAPKSKSRGKVGRKWYICVTCQSHFDTEEEISYHEKLDSCFTPQPGSLQSHPGVGIGQITSNEQSSTANSVQVDAVNGLTEGTQRGGPVVKKMGESWPKSPGRIYVSPYASPRLASRLGGNSRSSSNSISAQGTEPTPSLPLATPPRLDTTVPYPDAKWSKSVRSAASSVESDLETTIPHALNEVNGPQANSASMQRFPSTATQPEEPFTQVKRTPYVNGYLHNKAISYTSSSKGRTNDSSFTISTNRNRQEATPHHSSPRISSTKSLADQDDCMDTAEDYPAHQKDSTMGDKMTVAKQIQPEAHAQSQNSRSVSPTKKQKGSAVKSPLLQSTSKSTPSEPSPRTADLSVAGVQSGFELKRRSYEPALLSPNVAKRRKHFKASTAFQFSQDFEVAQDPSILARAYRQEFLASRKSSASEQSDLDKRTSSIPGKITELVNQHKNQTVDVRDGNMLAKLEVNETLTNAKTNADASSSALSPLKNIPALMSEGKKRATTTGNDEDVLMTIEDQDVAVSAVPLTSEAQYSNVSGAVQGDLNNQDNHDNNTPNASEAQEEPDPASESAATKANDDHLCNTDELASLPSGVGHGRADLDSNSVGSNIGESTKTNEETASCGAQDGQGFHNQANASLPSREQSELHSNKPSLLESSTPTPVVVEGDGPKGEADVLMANVEPEISTETHDAVPPQDDRVSQSPPMTPVTVFERFKTTYPDYVGNEERFIAICKKVNALIQQDRMEHTSLWDDFIIRHMTEYPKYLQRCALDAEDPLPYERFYRNEIDEPIFTKRVVTPKNLREILGIGGQGDIVTPQQQHHLPQRPESIALMDVSATRSVKSPTRPVSVAVSTPKPPPPQATVDLTNDSDDTEPIQSSTKRPRLLPWMSSSPMNGVQSPLDPKPSLRNSAECLSSPPRTSTKLKAQPSRDGLYDSRKPALRAAFLTPSPRTSVRLKAQSGAKTVEAVPKGTNDDKSSPSISNPNAETPQPERDIPKDWWKDDNTPYKKFARAYLAIRPGKGNSFAMCALNDAGAKGK